MLILANMSGGNTVVQFLTALLIFVFVIVLTHYTLKWVGSYQKTQAYNKNFEVIETFKVAGNKYLQIIMVGSRYFLIGIGKDTIEYLAELSEEELDLSPKTGAKDSFLTLLKKAKNQFHDKRGSGDE